MKSIKIRIGNKNIISNVKLLESQLEQSIGLMFKKKGNVMMKLRKESIPYSSIHTFFCKPLIVAWLNKNMKVVDVKKTKSFWFYSSKKPAMYIFETTNMRTEIKIGQKWKILSDNSS